MNSGFVVFSLSPGSKIRWSLARCQKKAKLVPDFDTSFKDLGHCCSTVVPFAEVMLLAQQAKVAKNGKADGNVTEFAAMIKEAGHKGGQITYPPVH